MSEQNDESPHPQGETLPPQSRPEGETALEKGDVEWEEKGAKGGDETHGAGEHDRPND